MRILYFSKDYSTHDHRFLSALAKTEHEVFYLRLEHNAWQVEDRPVPQQVQQVQWAGGRSSGFRWRDVPRLAVDLRRVVREIKPELIHAGPVQSSAFLAALSGFRPLLTMSWGFDLMEAAERDWWWRWVTRFTLRRSTFFVSDAEVTRKKAIAHGMRSGCTEVFPWGVDLEHFRPQGRPQRAAKAGNRPFVLFCSRGWERYYGVDVLARAFVTVSRECPEARLLLLGAGSQAQAIRQILSSGQALERVQFAGQVSQTDLPRWYGMADLYISPSHIDGSSVSLMEALACGLPPLVSDIPGNREWITDGANGWLFADGDAEALARRILEIIAKRDELAEIRRAARRTAEQKADWSKNFAVLLEAYQRAVQAAA
jgi:glycosyltransferase involved in cell wall biosynthesis